MLPAGRTFYKMSGSGNDFVMVDARRQPPGATGDRRDVQAICARGTGVGADGIVFLERSWAADFRMIYLNSDGSRADLCGNATLCSVRLAVELGIMPVGECHVETDAGVLSARLLPTGPEIDLLPVADVKPQAAISARARASSWIGFAAGRRAAPRRPCRRCGDGRRGGPRPAAAVRQHRSRRARTSTSSRRTGAGAGGSAPTSAASKERPWRAERAPSRPPSCSTRTATPTEAGSRRGRAVAARAARASAR